ncbi:glycosyltransferase [Agilicoccus flavus]|uniref:glycosyltransferase n=1 Tax=Agilicoccus flavus TaxID=2775968 RepID=UPI001CF633DE|nr:glycosyltransferase [Agilicoccus flavus]
MRILIGTDTFTPDVNGAAVFTARLADGLAERGHDVHVVAPSTDRRSRVVAGDVTEHRVASLRWSRRHPLRVVDPVRADAVVAAAVADVAPDVVHVQGHVLVGRRLLRRAAAAGVASVATNHVMPENIAAQVPIPARWQEPMWAAAYRDLARVLDAADVVTAPTQRACDLLAERAGLHRARPISCGIDAARFGSLRRHRRPDGPVRLLFVGRLEKEKRIGELVDAVVGLPDRLDVRLDVVGDGTMRRAWAARAAASGRPDRFDFRGHVGDVELLHAYADADVFCMPSTAELQSLATLEAMCAGTAVVAADAMALPHLVRPGVNGELYRPGDVAELGAHLTTLVDDTRRRDAYAAAGRLIAEGHGLAATLRAFEGVYEEVVAARRPHRRLGLAS